MATAGCAIRPPGAGHETVPPASQHRRMCPAPDPGCCNRRRLLHHLVASRPGKTAGKTRFMGRIGHAGSDQGCRPGQIVAMRDRITAYDGRFRALGFGPDPGQMLPDPVAQCRQSTGSVYRTGPVHWHPAPHRPRRIVADCQNRQAPGGHCRNQRLTAAVRQASDPRSPGSADGRPEKKARGQGFLPGAAARQSAGSSALAPRTPDGCLPPQTG